MVTLGWAPYYIYIYIYIYRNDYIIAVAKELFRHTTSDPISGLQPSAYNWGARPSEP